MVKGFVIAAVSSGSGKTTFSNGLLRALSRLGLVAAPFKVGPDYIDTHYHKVASGRDSINLDLFMGSESHVKNLYAKYSEDCDIAVVEGVMGLYDGYDRKEGSASHIAKLLGLPVVLLINAASSAYSLAAVLAGFKMFDTDIRIAGVIFNNVASDNHLQLLKAAAEDAGIKYLGHIRRNKDLAVPSRHLGLSLDDGEVIEQFVDKAADAVEDGVDLDELLRQISIESEDDGKPTVVREDSIRKASKYQSTEEKDSGVIAVAHDDAFNFIYPENIHALKFLRLFNGRRMRIVEFSPLRDAVMPDAEMLYLPGGYPELYAERLAANESMRRSIKEFIENGGRVLAECGGMLYLGDEIDGSQMCGVFPVKASMQDARLRLGYRNVKFDGFEIRGHEFHYSKVEELLPLKSVAKQFDVRGNEVDTPVYRYKNCIAGYTHLYWAEKDISELWRKED